MLEKDALEFISDQSAGFNSHLFLVEKARGIKPNHQTLAAEHFRSFDRSLDGNSGVSPSQRPLHCFA